MITEIKNLITQIPTEQKRRVLVICITGLVLLILDIFFIFSPLINKSFDLKSQVVSIKKNIANLNQEISMLDTTKKKLETLRTNQVTYEKKFPKEEGVPVLIGEFSTIAGKMGVDIIAVKPVKMESAQKAGSLFHEVPIEIFGKGGYHQIGQFINRLETLDKFMEIKDVEITADTATPRRHFFRLLVATYILRT